MRPGSGDVRHFGRGDEPTDASGGAQLGLPPRPPIVRRELLRRAAPAGVLSVTVTPGWTTVAVMPNRQSSSAMFFVIAATATLRTDPTSDPVSRALTPQLLMIRPQRCAAISDATARMHRK